MPASKTPHSRIYAAIMILADILCVLALLRGGSITVLRLSDRIQLAFSVDGLTRCVLPAVMLLYTVVLFYAFAYMAHAEHQDTFFVFYLVSFAALAAVCFSANLVTLYLCFEFLTLTTVPLVLHERTKEAVTAGLKYLFYSIAGALMGLLAVFFVYHFSSGTGAFVMGGFLEDVLLYGHEGVLLGAVMAGIIGFGTKAGLYPMHGWLPTAHPIAPAPASALLSGIVAKAGVVALIRLVYYSVGTARIAGTWVQTVWMTLAVLTVFMGSMMAFQEKNLKKRLAYSTISQISYILLGLSFLGGQGLAGGLLHLLGHCAAKGCLFLTAGVCMWRLGIREVNGMKGVGRRIPVTMCCFTVAALSLVGIPPFAGFTSKWVIASAAIGSGIPVFSVLAPVMLLVSALLTAGYLLPVSVEAFFPAAGDGAGSSAVTQKNPAGPAQDNPAGGSDGQESAHPAETDRKDPGLTALLPMIILCAVVLLMGLWGQGFVTACGFAVQGR